MEVGIFARDVGLRQLRATDLWWYCPLCSVETFEAEWKIESVSSFAVRSRQETQETPDPRNELHVHSF